MVCHDSIGGFFLHNCPKQKANINNQLATNSTVQNKKPTTGSR